jgi:hypothetical protein
MLSVLEGKNKLAITITTPSHVIVKSGLQCEKTHPALEIVIGLG